MARKVSLNSLRNLKNFAKFFNPDNITEGTIMALADKGEEIIRIAYWLKDWDNRTYNLYNSFVSAVFVDGELDKRTVRFLEKDPHQPEDKTITTTRIVNGVTIDNGRDEAWNFLASYEKGKKRGKGSVVLVIAAAMFYSGILESSGYQVLSNIVADLDELSRDGLKVKAKLAFSERPEDTTLVVPLGKVLRTDEDYLETGRTDNTFKIL